MYLLSVLTENFDQPEDNELCKNVRWWGGNGSSNGEKLEKADAKGRLKSWQTGKTGYPFIDALMRQLVTTGWMHHLGRHAAACFLTRGDLFLNWTHGRDFFDKHLLDGDWALNNGNWLWLAGVAPFSMPFFRVYSPSPLGSTALNAEQTGGFVKYWVPEVKGFGTAKLVYGPWEASQVAQMAAKCVIGKDYPARVVDHKTESKKNIDHFKKELDRLKSAAGGRKGSMGRKRSRSRSRGR